VPAADNQSKDVPVGHKGSIGIGDFRVSKK